MRFLFVDTETHLIKPGLAAPRLVCVSIADTFVDQDEVLVFDAAKRLGSKPTFAEAAKQRAFTSAKEPKLFLRDDGLRFMQAALEDQESIIVGHQIFYDLGVLCAEDPGTFVPLVFKALDDFRIRDTIIRQQLIDIVTGNLKYRWDEGKGEYVKTGYSLADLALRLLGRVLPKEGTWRLRYALLDGVPLAEWPEDAKRYAIDDAVTTRDVFWKQAEESNADLVKRAVGGEIPTEERATREAWALWLMSAWGVRTDGEAVAKLKAELEKEQAEAMAKLAGTGIYKQARNGKLSKDMKVIYAKVQAGFAAQGRGPAWTPSGRPSTEHESLEESGDPDLKVLADASKGAKLLNTYVPMLEHGMKYPINARFNVLVESNRTSCAGPNLQNPPRKGGVRECFQAREGYVYCSVDYDTIELRSLAQSCLDLLGFSEMAGALRKGEDLHLNLAADFMGISREEARQRYEAGDVKVAEQRQLMKPANFGFPGGMASDSFVDYAKGYGYIIDSGLAQRIYEQWHKAWPEMHHYFEKIKTLVDGPESTIISPRSGFVRGGLRFTQAANHMFQSLTATGAKDAMWHVARECYSVPSSPLWGCRPVVFLHDEVITEMPEERAAEAAERQVQVMVEVMQRWIPNIPIKASPVLMRRWYKGAKAVRVDGKLVPSRPEESDGKIKWVHDEREEVPHARLREENVGRAVLAQS
jgi:DNA polymerase I-like protein with 3'-5' exonuclease and polymerase domains